MIKWEKENNQKGGIYIYVSRDLLLFLLSLGCFQTYTL